MYEKIQYLRIHSEISGDTNVAILSVQILLYECFYVFMSQFIFAKYIVDHRACVKNYSYILPQRVIIISICIEMDTIQLVWLHPSNI